METGGVIAVIIGGCITISAGLVKMMDKNGIFCECKGCGCECKIDGRKSKTRQMELKNEKKQSNNNQTSDFVEIELDDKPTRKKRHI